MSQGLRIYPPVNGEPGEGMARDDERLDRVVEALQQINVNLEGLRVTLVDLTETSAITRTDCGRSSGGSTA